MIPRRRLLLAALARTRAFAHQQHQQHSSSLLPAALAPRFSTTSTRSMSAVAEAPPAAKKGKAAYGEHTREVSLRRRRRDKGKTER